MKIFWFVFLASVVLLAGCGGGGGGGGGSSHSMPAVTVSWPDRSRDFSAPSSALSVHVVIHRTDSASEDIVIDGNRSSVLTTHNETYAATATASTQGTYSLIATFYSAASGGGRVVGATAANVKVTSNGTLTDTHGQPLGTMAFSGAVKSATVPAGQFIRVGDEGTIVGAAFDASNNMVVVSPGSFVFTLVSGGTNMSLTADGTVHGLVVGNATVHATIDGITTADSTIEVTPITASAAVNVAWPARTRDFSSPSSALSIRVVLHRTDMAEDDVTLNSNRNATLTAHTEIYTAPRPLATNGSYSLVATFYANADQAGAVVGTAAADVKIAVDGTLTNLQGQPLGTVSFTGTVKSAVLVAGQSVRVGQHTVLVASALDAASNPVVVTPGSFSYDLVSGGANATLLSNGRIDGVSAGNATVSATIDGVTSPAAIVVVIPASPVITKVNLETNDVIYDPAREVVYASTTPGAPSHPGQVVTLDAATGAIGTVYSPGNSPTWMALSGNGSHLYVGGSDGTVKRLAMPSGAIEGSLTLPAGTVPAHMMPVPNTQDSWVLALQNAGGAATTALVYDGLTARSKTALMGHIVALNDAGTRVYGFQRFQSSGSHYYTADITVNGLENATSAVTTIQGFGNRISWANGHILSDDGTIADPDTAVKTGQLSMTTVDHVTGNVRASNRVYYAAWDPKQVMVYDLNNSNPVANVQLGAVSGGLETTTTCGPNRIVIRSFSGSPNTVILVSGLP